MKIIISLLVFAYASTFAGSGIIGSWHFTVRTKTKVCAIDIVQLDTGRYVSEKICFPIK